MESMPVEIFDHILENLKFTEVLKLRLVSRSWESIVASFNSRKLKSLALFRDNYYTDGSISRRLCEASTSNRLFGAVKIESFPKIALPMTSTTALTKDQTESILKLFPNIEQLAFRAPMDLSTAMNLASLLIRWKNISTLSLVTNAYSDEFKIPIATAINGLTGLIRLDLRLRFDTSLLSQTLARLHHLSLGFELREDDLLEIIRQIGPHCTRLWIKPLVGANKLCISNVQSWMRANVKLFSRLTHFGCTSHIDNEGMKFIDTHFISLHVWYIHGATRGSTFAEMGHVSRLNELRVLDAFGSIPDILARGRTSSSSEPMRNVNFFEFQWNYGWSVGAVTRFCAELVWLLPNVEHMNLVFNIWRPWTAYDFLFMIIEQSLFIFKNLRKCELRGMLPGLGEEYVCTWENKRVPVPTF